MDDSRQQLLLFLSKKKKTPQSKKKANSKERTFDTPLAAGVESKDAPVDAVRRILQLKVSQQLRIDLKKKIQKWERTNH